MKLEFSGHILEKYPNINFLENPSSVSRVVPCGQTGGRMDRPADGWTDGQSERHDEANSCFRNFANAPKQLKFET